VNFPGQITDITVVYGDSFHSSKKEGDTSLLQEQNIGNHVAGSSKSRKEPEGPTNDIFSANMQLNLELGM